jgi:hypothetical protein
MPRMPMCSRRGISLVGQPDGSPGEPNVTGIQTRIPIRARKENFHTGIETRILIRARKESNFDPRKE